jgi:Domain of unknown function (DUF4411)
MYAIDTNIYLDWWIRRYPADVFPTFRAQVEALIDARKWNAVERVSDEIGHVGTAELKAWAKTKRAQFIKHDASLIAEANAVTRAYPGLIDPYARHDEADRYLIALAKLRGWTVVTHETPARSKKHALRTHFIPDVCQGLHVPCIDLLELMRREKWSFR